MEIEMKNIFKTTLLVSGMIASSSLMAATPGTLGTTSTGTLDIEVDVEDLVMISGLSDIAIAFDNTGTGDLTGSSTACIYRNGAGTYSVNATGDGGVGGTDFSIQNATPVPTVVPYTVEWDDDVAGSNYSAVALGTALTGQSGANTTDTACGTGANAIVQVTVPRASLAAAPAGTYNGTLTLEIAPE